MIRLQGAEINNYKGIKHLEIDFDVDPARSIHPIIGLNESGKTTFLEALTFVSTTNEDLSSLEITGLRPTPEHELIPIAQRSSFTGEISVRLTFVMEESDRDEIMSEFEKVSGYRLRHLPLKFSLTRSIEFKNAEAVKRMGFYDFPTAYDKVKARQAKPEFDKLWPLERECISKRLPALLYVPNFLFGIPNKIPLKPIASLENSRDAFFHKLLDGLLQSKDSSASFADSIVARSGAQSDSVQQAFSASVTKLEHAINQNVISNWSVVGGQALSGLSTALQVVKDGNGESLAITLKQQGNVYKIGDRSLGFRWFFAFLMLTYYSKSLGRNRQVVFLLDEPASNLHANAQTKLLKTLQALENSLFIYSTHSHYLLEPDLLPLTFVARNLGYDSSRDEDYVAEMTDIRVEPFREFVSKHPMQTEHFSVALDVLDVPVSGLEINYPCVFLEGKSDWYYIKLAKNSGLLDGFSAYPCGGVNTLDFRVSKALGEDSDFALLVDGDTKIKQKLTERYGETITLRCLSLSDIIAPGASGESFFSDGDKAKIVAAAGLKGTSKAKIQRSAEMLVAGGVKVDFDEQTKGRFALLGDSVKQLFEKTKLARAE